MPEGNQPVLRPAAHILLQVPVIPQRILPPPSSPASLRSFRRPARPAPGHVRWPADNQPPGRQIYSRHKHLSLKSIQNITLRQPDRQCRWCGQFAAPALRQTSRSGAAAPVTTGTCGRVRRWSADLVVLPVERICPDPGRRLVNSEHVTRRDYPRPEPVAAWDVTSNDVTGYAGSTSSNARAFGKGSAFLALSGRVATKQNPYRQDARRDCV